MTCPTSRLASCAISTDVYGFYQDFQNGIQLYHYNPTGTTYSTRLYAPSSTINPFCGSGIACVGWSDGTGVYHLRVYFQNSIDSGIYQMAQDGKTNPWGSPTLVTLNARNSTKIAACHYNNGSDVINLFFQDHTDNLAMAQYTSTNGGTSFSKNATYSCSTGIIDSSDISAVYTPAVTGFNAMIQVIFQDGSYNIRINQYDLGLSSWNDFAVVSLASGDLTSLTLVSQASATKDLKMYYSYIDGTGVGHLVDYINNSNGSAGHWGGGTLTSYYNTVNLNAGFSACSYSNTIYTFYMSNSVNSILNSNSIYQIKCVSGTYASGYTVVLNNFAGSFTVTPFGTGWQMTSVVNYKTTITYTFTDSATTNPPGVLIATMPFNYLMYLDPAVVSGAVAYTCSTDQYQGAYMSLIQSSTPIADVYFNPVHSTFLTPTTIYGNGNF